VSPGCTDVLEAGEGLAALVRIGRLARLRLGDPLVVEVGAVLEEVVGALGSAMGAAFGGERGDGASNALSGLFGGGGGGGDNLG
jgi:hypothetical protein